MPGMPIPVPVSKGDVELLDRFMAKVEKTDGCWNWTAFVSVYGYGYIGIKGKRYAAHRVSYTLFVGPIPSHLQLDHLCRNRKCVRPDHLEAVTCRVNQLRGKTLGAERASRTHCPKGHPLKGSNIRFCGPNKIHRRCRICAIAHDRDYYNRVCRVLKRWRKST